MNCSNSSDRPSPSIAPPTRSFLVLLADGTRHRVVSRDLAAQLRQERSGQLKRLRQARSEALARVADGVADARVRREFEAGEREMDAAIRRLSKQVRIKPELQRRTSPEPIIKSKAHSTGHRGLVRIDRPRTSSALARRDGLGREGIMLRITYVRAGGKHASPGCIRRHWRYIAREAAVTLDSDGQPIIPSNLGDTIEEVAEGLAIQEQVLRAMRKNAKLGFRIVGAFPYGLPVDARRDALHRIGEQVFGVRGLPWSGAAHDADPEAKVDNPHFHLDYSHLPMERQADGSYIVSNNLRTDIDGREGLRFIRHMVAQIMTEVAQEYGLERTFTALSYRERGMDREGGEHIGQEGTAAHRRGEHVASVERNEARRRRDDARERARKARERLDALERLKRAMAESVEDAPSLSVPPEIETIDTDVSEVMAVVPAMIDIPALADIPAADLVPRMSAPPSTPIIDLPAEVAQINDGPAITVASAPEGPPSGPALPAIVPLPGKAGAVHAPPSLWSIGKGAPKVEKLPALFGVGDPALSVPSDGLNAISTAAPVMELVPVATPLNHHVVPIVQSPPVISRIGKPAPRLPAAESIIWDIGHGIAADSEDEATEKRLAEVVKQEAERRRQTAAMALDHGFEVDATQPHTEVTASMRTMPVGPVVLADALDALRQRDEWIGPDEQGFLTFSDETLRAVGLTRADIIAPDVQVVLKGIGDQLVDRFDPVFEDRSGRTPFRFDQGALRLDLRFPAKLQADVVRWSADPHFRSFVAKVWPNVQIDPGSGPDNWKDESEAKVAGRAPHPAVPADPWMQAAAVRQRAMADWDQVERSDTVGMSRPGRVLTRPGQPAVPDVGDPAPNAHNRAHPHPGIFHGGGGIGG